MVPGAAVSSTVSTLSSFSSGSLISQRIALFQNTWYSRGVPPLPRLSKAQRQVESVVSAITRPSSTSETVTTGIGP